MPKESDATQRREEKRRERANERKSANILLSRELDAAL